MDGDRLPRVHLEREEERGELHVTTVQSVLDDGTGRYFYGVTTGRDGNSQRKRFYRGDGTVSLRCHDGTVW